MHGGSMKKQLSIGYEEALARLPEALKSEGFGILTEIDTAVTSAPSLWPRHFGPEKARVIFCTSLPDKSTRARSATMRSSQRADPLTRAGSNSRSDMIAVTAPAIQVSPALTPWARASGAA